MPLKLNLGSGYRRHVDYVNIDIDPDCQPDIILDIAQNRFPLNANTVDEVVAVDFLEHIPLGRTVFVIEEIYRVLKHKGRFLSMTPSTEGLGAFQAPNHLSFWNVNSWLYYMDDSFRAQCGIRAKFSGIVSRIGTENPEVPYVFADLQAEKKGVTKVVVKLVEFSGPNFLGLDDAAKQIRSNKHIVNKLKKGHE